MPKAKMRVIPDPAPGSASVFITDRTDPDFVFAKSEGKWDYLCGKCGRALAKKMLEGQVRGMIFKCPGCGSFNDIGGTTN